MPNPTIEFTNKLEGHKPFNGYFAQTPEGTYLILDEEEKVIGEVEHLVEALPIIIDHQERVKEKNKSSELTENQQSELLAGLTIEE